MKIIFDPQLCLVDSSSFRNVTLSFLSWKELAKKGKEKQIPLKDDDKDQIEELTEKLKKAIKLKETAKSTENKLLAATAIEEAKAAIKLVRSHCLILCFMMT